MEATQIDLSKFFGKSKGGYTFDESFVIGGYRYATDHSILIRVPTEEADTPAGTKRFPLTPSNVDYAVSPLKQVAAWLPWPAADYVLLDSTCQKCDGTGAAKETECEECQGSGVVECFHCMRDMECGECDGVGLILEGACEACKGAKHFEQPHHIVVSGRSVDVEYDAMIRALPDVEFGVTAESPRSPLAFRFKGGEGLVMPIIGPVVQRIEHNP